MSCIFCYLFFFPWSYILVLIYTYTWIMGLKACTRYERYNLLRAFSHDVTAAILVSVPKNTLGVVLFSYVNVFFLSISIDAGHVSENATWVKTLIWRKHQCSIDQSCCSMTSKRFLESSSGMKFFQPSVRLTNQRPGAFVSVR